MVIGHLKAIDGHQRLNDGWRIKAGLRKALRQMSVGEYQLAGERIVVLVEGTAGGEQSKRHGDGVWQSAVWVG